jgi:hypothetical protein
VMAEPGDHGAAAAGGHGRLRASHADREQVIEALKNAFVQGRLDKDELEARAGQAFASRTYAELAAVTADIPAGIPAGPAAEPAPGPASTPARTLAKAAVRSGICLLIPLALVGIIALTNATGLVPLAFIFGAWAFIAASGFVGYGVVDAWHERRSRGQLPPRPRRDGRGLEGGRSASSGRDPALPAARTDQTRADLRTHRPNRDRRHPSGRSSRAPRGTRLIPGAV